MLEYDYLKEVKEAVRDFLEENPPYVRDFANCIECERVDDKGECEYFFNDLSDFKEDLDNELWLNDNVTGNGSGSYTFNREEAKRNILENGMETLKDVIDVRRTLQMPRFAWCNR